MFKLNFLHDFCTLWCEAVNAELKRVVCVTPDIDIDAQLSISKEMIHLAAGKIFHPKEGFCPGSYFNFYLKYCYRYL